MSFDTIVVGVDGSVNADRALEVAADLAIGGSSTVHVVCAYQPVSHQQFAEVMAALPEEFRDSYDPVAGTRDVLTAAEQFLDERHIDHKGHLPAGNPAGEILDIADRVGADLIVVGSRGLGMTGRFLRGSTSARIANHAHCSFLVVQD